MSMLFSCRIPAPGGILVYLVRDLQIKPVHEDVAELVANGDRRVVDHDSRGGPPWLRVVGKDEKSVFWLFVDSKVNGFLHVPNDDPRALSVQGYNSGPECLRGNTFNKRSTERGEAHTLFSGLSEEFFLPDLIYPQSLAHTRNQTTPGTPSTPWAHRPPPSASVLRQAGELRRFCRSQQET